MKATVQKAHRVVHTHHFYARKEAEENAQGDEDDAEAEPSPRPSPQPEPDNEVWNLLLRCNPPMTRLHGHFLNYGLIGRQYLAAVMAWPDVQILAFLERLRRDSGGQMSKMDVEVLLYHLSEINDIGRA